jgi:hypothetical protein
MSKRLEPWEKISSKPPDALKKKKVTFFD